MATLLSDLAWDTAEIEAGALRRTLHLAPRFSLELAPDLILAPHLYGYPDAKRWNERGFKRHRKRCEMYTVQECPAFVLYVSRSECQRRYLETEIAPALPPEVDLYVVEPGAGRVRVLHDAGTRTREIPLAALCPDLDARLGVPVFGDADLDFLCAPWGHPEFETQFYSTVTHRAERVEQHPTRLWEAFLLRGHWERWELVRGEVPLVAVLPSPAAAGATLGRWLADAVRWSGAEPDPQAAWIRVGPFRFRQTGCQVDARVRLSPADVRVAFMPARELPGSEDLPTLAGLLCAGNEGAKVEMLNGYAWATADCEEPGEVDRVGPALVEEIRRLGAREVDLVRDLPEFPEGADHRWVVELRDHYVTVFMPLGYEGSTFWDVHARRWRHLDAERIPLRIVRADDEAPAPELAERIQAAFAAGCREVWQAGRRDDGAGFVDVHRADGVVERRLVGETLFLSGVTPGPVPVRAFLHRHGGFLADP
ncbi:hypothetical protein L6V77_31830 [Myxococcota bacterium]|nr:hypothetical protein [Myxococcota bacterium]